MLEITTLTDNIDNYRQCEEYLDLVKINNGKGGEGQVLDQLCKEKNIKVDIVVRRVNGNMLGYIDFFRDCKSYMKIFLNLKGEIRREKGRKDVGILMSSSGSDSQNDYPWRYEIWVPSF